MVWNYIIICLTDQRIWLIDCMWNEDNACIKGCGTVWELYEKFFTASNGTQTHDRKEIFALQLTFEWCHKHLIYSYQHNHFVVIFEFEVCLWDYRELWTKLMSYMDVMLASNLSVCNQCRKLWKHTMVIHNLVWMDSKPGMHKHCKLILS